MVFLYESEPTVHQPALADWAGVTLLCVALRQTGEFQGNGDQKVIGTNGFRGQGL